MPLFHLLSWIALIRTGFVRDPTTVLYATLATKSSLLCLWALCKVSVKDGNRVKKELRQYTMGLTAVATLAHAKYAALGAIAVVIVHYALPVYLVLGLSASKLAVVVQKSDLNDLWLWACMFKGYLLSNVLFWCLAFFKVLNLP